MCDFLECEVPTVAEATKKIMRSRYGQQVIREFRDGVLKISLFLVVFLGVFLAIFLNH